MSIIDTVEEQMAAENDSFTLTDRKELIRQGLTLERIVVDIEDLKVLFNETIKRGEEIHARGPDTGKSGRQERYSSPVALEDANLTLRTQLSAARWIAGIIGGVVAVLVEIGMKLFFHG